ncbi:MAG: acyl-CoA thioesterase [Alphaproteobacteria bacterium]|jgi:acyl-CoA thioester hydrolase|nr:acyl-CoA thioesterase [Alphaproteobacteria bacterium]MBT7942273.1 acyl-CoA thioesterase [Alphaproteobacteria bacterium]
MARSEFRFSWPLRVRYSEIDGQMVVFNAHYLTYFDIAITEYFRSLPYDYMGQVASTGEDFHTVRALVEFQQPILFDEDIDVHVRTARLGRTSLTFLIEIHGTGADDLRATGEVVWVNTDQKTHTPAPLAQELVDKLGAFEGENLER